MAKFVENVLSANYFEENPPQHKKRQRILLGSIQNRSIQNTQDELPNCDLI